MPVSANCTDFWAGCAVGCGLCAILWQLSFSLLHPQLPTVHMDLLGAASAAHAAVEDLQMGPVRLPNDPRPEPTASAAQWFSQPKLWPPPASAPAPQFPPPAPQLQSAWRALGDHHMPSGHVPGYPRWQVGRETWVY